MNGSIEPASVPHITTPMQADADGRREQIEVLGP